ncbi:hypothetical protein C8R43DRAFT_1118059 [Mycena crocata]|nr:hypothetical protein C8R43DRAFT_1118059 [Mycena crocata]
MSTPSEETLKTTAARAAGTALNDMMRETDNGTVLPSAQRLAPVVKDFRARQTMPKVKTRHPKAGDPLYGGGASSGSKAKPVKPKPSKAPALSQPSHPTASPSSHYPLHIHPQTQPTPAPSTGYYREQSYPPPVHPIPIPSTSLSLMSSS